MEIYKITDERFKKYGHVITGMELPEIMDIMAQTPCPEDVIYVASDDAMEACGDAKKVQDSLFGGLPENAFLGLKGKNLTLDEV